MKIIGQGLFLVEQCLVFLLQSLDVAVSGFQLVTQEVFSISIFIQLLFLGGDYVLECVIAAWFGEYVSFWIFE